MQAPAIDAPAADWLVYGDALQEAGDPRGELIGLSHAVAEGRTSADIRDAYVKEHARALLGEAAPHFAAYSFDWRFCVPLGVTVHVASADDLVGPLLAAPIMADLKSIALVGQAAPGKPVTLEGAMRRLVERRPPTCRSFAFVDERATKASMLVSRDFDPDTNLVTFGPLKPLFAIAETMRLEVADSYQLDLEDIDAPALRAFTLNSLRFTDWEEAEVMARRLGAAKWPALERFELRLTETWFANIPFETNPYVPVYSAPDEDEEEGSSRYDDEAEEGEPGGVNWNVLGDLLRTLAKCPLRRLALTGFYSASSLLETIGEVGLAPTLEELDFSDSAFGDEHAAWIAANPTAFRGLARIVLTRTPVGESGLAILRRLGPEIVHSPGDGVTYRYVVGQE